MPPTSQMVTQGLARRSRNAPAAASQNTSAVKSTVEEHLGVPRHGPRQPQEGLIPGIAGALDVVALRVADVKQEHIGEPRKRIMPEPGIQCQEGGDGGAE